MASDLLVGDTGGFNTLFDTGHKFYGYMDFFLAGVQPGGLHDVAVKFKVQPAAKTTLKLDVHHFARSSSINPAAGGLACPTCSPGARTLGQEIDLTAVYKYSASTAMSLGYSHFFTRDAMPVATGGQMDQDDRDWLYVMFDVKF